MNLDVEWCFDWMVLSLHLICHFDCFELNYILEWDSCSSNDSNNVFSHIVFQSCNFTFDGLLGYKIGCLQKDPQYSFKMFVFSIKGFLRYSYTQEVSFVIQYLVVKLSLEIIWTTIVKGMIVFFWCFEFLTWNKSNTSFEKCSFCQLMIGIR